MSAPPSTRTFRVFTLRRPESAWAAMSWLPGACAARRRAQAPLKPVDLSLSLSLPLSLSFCLSLRLCACVYLPICLSLSLCLSLSVPISGGAPDLEAGPGAVGVAERQRAERLRDLLLDCPGRKPPFSAVKRPACPYKPTIVTRFTAGHAKAA